MTFPKWLKRQIIYNDDLKKTEKILRDFHLNTVCQEAKCPNIMECFAKKKATFLALGNKCSRKCSFCNIGFAKKLPPPDKEEIIFIAKCIKELHLKHAVITMVTRDDLPDKGANHLAQIVREIKKTSLLTKIELLTSDFGGEEKLINIILKEDLYIFNHNVETVRSLHKKIKPQSSYECSLKVLSYAKKSSTTLIKSGLMVGLGEKEQDVKETINDLYEAGCDIITIGQYLQPHKKNIKVKNFVSPEQFKEYERYALLLGIKYVYSSAFVRSSYIDM
jgi:lipoic acid synthetase